MNMKYLNYLFKKEKNTNMVLIIIGMMVYPFMAMTTNIDFTYTDPKGIFYMFNSFTNLFMAYIYVLTVIMVVVNFRYLHSKRSVDTYMQLPLSKKEVFVNKLVYTLLQVIIPAIVIYVMGSLILYYRGYPFYGTYVLYVCVVMLIGLSLLIFINIFIYQLCNNMIDGIIIMLMYHGLFILADFFVNLQLLSFNQISTVSFFSFDWTYFNIIYSKFSVQEVLEFTQFSFNEIKAIIFFVVIGIAALVLSVREVAKRSGERAEQITDSHFCYPVIIIGYASMLYMLIMDIYYYDFSDMLFYALLIFIPYIIGMFIYNRKILLKRKYIITYVVIILASSGFMYLVGETGTFGLKYQLPDNYGSVIANIRYYNEGLEFDFEGFEEKLDDRVEITEGDFYNNSITTSETTLFFNGYAVNYNRTAHIEDFEQLLLDNYANDGNAYRTKYDGYCYMTIEYFDSTGSKFEKRYVDLFMSEDEFIAFINSTYR